ncbi:hypothetical protein GURASL_24770 [Geotalea uraniireducens]|uniref:Uncharacterized protein n=1 Tax=Geotalea uraniireducens TaxID=351604 RepID=A0ABN6VT68_9BACT|nr:hypothetical protein [Geotalea uraniireducens]BDV43554.1 hypothetical protein GURASL_24770 [Geotalea uraniireducens]
MDKLRIIKGLNKISHRLSDNELRLYLLMLAAAADDYCGTILHSIIGESVPFFIVPGHLAAACSRLQDLGLIETNLLQQGNWITYRILVPTPTAPEASAPTDQDTISGENP